MAKIIGPSGLILDVEDIVASGLVDGRYVTETTPEPEGAEEAPAEPVEVAEVTPVTETTPEPAETVGEMPKGNAGLDAWAAFATANGKDVEGMSRDEIRALFKE
jgi:hypothetical protein